MKWRCRRGVDSSPSPVFLIHRFISSKTSAASLCCANQIRQFPIGLIIDIDVVNRYPFFFPPPSPSLSLSLSLSLYFLLPPRWPPTWPPSWPPSLRHVFGESGGFPEFSTLLHKDKHANNRSKRPELSIINGRPRVDTRPMNQPNFHSSIDRWNRPLKYRYLTDLVTHFPICYQVDNSVIDIQTLGHRYLIIIFPFRFIIDR